MRAYEITPEALDCQGGEIPHLHFTPEAYAIWWPWYLDLRKRARDIPEALASHLMKYSSLVPALALIGHIADQEGGNVGIESIQRAIGITDWLWQHAQRVYLAAGHSKRSRLRQLASRIKHRRLGDKFTLRDLKERGWTGIIKDDSQSLLDELVLMDWLSHTKVTGQKGGSPSHVYTVNPRVFTNSHGQNLPAQPAQPTEKESYAGYAGKKRESETGKSDIPPKEESTRKTSHADETGYF